MEHWFNCQKILVLGSGSWGTAMALHIARQDYEVYLWGRSEEKLAHMQAARENTVYLPGIPFPDNLHVVSDLPSAMAQAEAVFCMVPSHGFVHMLEQIQPHYRPNVPFIWGTKGMLDYQGKLVCLHEAVNNILGASIPQAIISGPTFASEVAAELPAAVVVAAKNKAVATKLQLLLHSEVFRVYTSDDIVGVQICGAVKNVLAVAAGISDGLGLGANTRSALITRGLVEMRRIAVAVGCRQDTLMGLSGMGDLILTATSDLSRNRRLGLALGQGMSVQQAQASIGQVIESTYNATLLQSYGRKNQLEMPITDQVCAVLAGQVSPHEAVHNLLSRAPRAEFTLD